MSPARARLWGVLVGVGLGAVAALAGYHTYRTLGGSEAPALPAPGPDRQIATLVGEPRPPFSLPDLDGVPHSISEWDGKLVLLNFWATWCPPCIKEIPVLVALQERHGPAGLQVIGIAIDEVANVREFLGEIPVNYPVLVGQLAAIEAGEAYGNHLGGLPFTALVDRAGRIAAVQAGALTEAQAQALVADRL